MSYIEDNVRELGYEPLPEALAAAASHKYASIVGNIEAVIAGKHEAVELTVLCLIAGGHVLIEDIPGVGKTSLVSALAKSINCNFKRIQFTPDVMPSDVTGFSVYNQKSGEFEFRPGAAMSNIVLADEINRASAKTQSAMLEIMEERQVTVDANTYVMEQPFMVLATQNPIESLGTYQLPEAQIDRFMIKLSIGYPACEDEIKIVMQGERAKKAIGHVAEKVDVRALSDASGRVVCAKSVTEYIVRIIEATRNHSDIKLGSSPRGSIALYKLSRAYALSRGRNFVLPDDVKYLAPYVLGHRLILTHAAAVSKKSPAEIIKSIVKEIAVPVSLEATEV
jgi:MoxR-like ATPase